MTSKILVVEYLEDDQSTGSMFRSYDETDNIEQILSDFESMTGNKPTNHFIEEIHHD